MGTRFYPRQTNYIQALNAMDDDVQLAIAKGEGAAQAQVGAESARDLAALWASKMATTVDGTSYSAKQYALNAEGSATAASGHVSTAQKWATQLGSAVAGGEYSAKYHAQAAAASASSISGSVGTAQTAATTAQNWATQLGTPVAAGEYSAKYHAQAAAASASSISGSVGTAQTAATAAQNWATQASGEVVSGQGYSAKYHAVAAAGSASSASTSATLAQNWATKATGEVVAGQGYSAKYWAQQAAASAAQATAGQINSDWNATSGVAQILNKPSVYTKAETDAISANYTDLSLATNSTTVIDASNFETYRNKHITIALNASLDVISADLPQGWKCRVQLNGSSAQFRFRIDGVDQYTTRTSPLQIELYKRNNQLTAALVFTPNTLLSSTAPLANGTATAGTSMRLAREDHVHPETVLDSTKVVAALGYTPWHAGNDGSGSGLDADLLDGANADAAATAGTITKRTSTGAVVGSTLVSAAGDNEVVVGSNSVKIGKTGRTAYGEAFLDMVSINGGTAAYDVRFKTYNGDVAIAGKGSLDVEAADTNIYGELYVGLDKVGYVAIRGASDGEPYIIPAGTGNQNLGLYSKGSGSKVLINGYEAVHANNVAGLVRGTALTGLAAGTNAAITATDTVMGALAKAQTQLDNKEPAIAAPASNPTWYFWRGDKTWQDVGNTVRAVALAGISFATNAAVTAADGILAAIGKLQAQISAILKNGAYATASLSGTTFQVNPSNAAKYTLTATGAVTSYTFTGWPATGFSSVLVHHVAFGSYAITPWTGVTWTNPDGTETTSLSAHFTALAAAGGRSGFTASDKIVYWCENNGTVYGAFI